jgi:glycosyltransferase involved in cell wall biosynthesis
VPQVRIALLTTYLAGYRTALYEKLARDHGLEVLCYGGGERYMSPWIASDLDAKLAAAPFPARRLDGGARAAFAVGEQFDAVIAPYAGGAILPAAYLGARRHRVPFILWASVWAQPWSAANALALPLTRRIYRDADAIVAYGEHVRRFVAGIRGRDTDVFVAPQAVESDLFGRSVGSDEVLAFRARFELGHGPLVVFAGRLVHEKGFDVLLDAWAQGSGATLVAIGDGPLAGAAAATQRVAAIGPLPREELPVAYAACEFAVLASVPTRRFREPWGLVCNEAMHQGRPVLATTGVGAAAGGLVRDMETGLVVAPDDASALAAAITRLLDDEPLRRQLGERAREAVAPYTYDAMAAGFERALEVAFSRPASRSRSGRRRRVRGGGGEPPAGAG